MKLNENINILKYLTILIISNIFSFLGLSPFILYQTENENKIKMEIQYI
jgi:hypothetical protein